MAYLNDMKISFETVMQFLLPLYMPEGKHSGRGIVMCVGGNLVASAYVNLHIIRNVLDCKLPIEIWYMGEKDLSRDQRAIFHITFDIKQFCEASQVKNGWQLKAHALLNSSFKEVLLLDADNTPAVDPSFLFDETRSGSIFWPMLTDVYFNPEIQEVCKPPYDRMPAFESGQILVDKSKVFSAIWLANWMNEKSDFFYKHLYGDKDTFALAWAITKTPYILAPRPLAQSGVYYHKALDGSLLFQHRIGHKFGMDGYEHKIPGFKYENECYKALEIFKSLHPIVV